jgi:hypothetical protein
VGIPGLATSEKGLKRDRIGAGSNSGARDAGSRHRQAGRAGQAGAGFAASWAELEGEGRRGKAGPSGGPERCAGVAELTQRDTRWSGSEPEPGRGRRRLGEMETASGLGGRSSRLRRGRHTHDPNEVGPRPPTGPSLADWSDVGHGAVARPSRSSPWRIRRIGQADRARLRRQRDGTGGRQGGPGTDGRQVRSPRSGRAGQSDLADRSGPVRPCRQFRLSGSDPRIWPTGEGRRARARGAVESEARPARARRLSALRLGVELLGAGRECGWGGPSSCAARCGWWVHRGPETEAGPGQPPMMARTHVLCFPW